MHDLIIPQRAQLIWIPRYLLPGSRPRFFEYALVFMENETGLVPKTWLDPINLIKPKFRELLPGKEL